MATNSLLSQIFHKSENGPYTCYEKNFERNSFKKEIPEDQIQFELINLIDTIADNQRQFVQNVNILLEKLQIVPLFPSDQSLVKCEKRPRSRTRSTKRQQQKQSESLINQFCLKLKKSDGKLCSIRSNLGNLGPNCTSQDQSIDIEFLFNPSTINTTDISMSSSKGSNSSHSASQFNTTPNNHYRRRQSPKHCQRFSSPRTPKRAFNDTQNARIKELLNLSATKKQKAEQQRKALLDCKISKLRDQSDERSKRIEKFKEKQILTEKEKREKLMQKFMMSNTAESFTAITTTDRNNVLVTPKKNPDSASKLKPNIKKNLFAHYNNIMSEPQKPIQDSYLKLKQEEEDQNQYEISGYEMTIIKDNDNDDDENKFANNMEKFAALISGNQCKPYPKWAMGQEFLYALKRQFGQHNDEWQSKMAKQIFSVNEIFPVRLDLMGLPDSEILDKQEHCKDQGQNLNFDSNNNPDDAK